MTPSSEFNAVASSARVLVAVSAIVSLVAVFVAKPEFDHVPNESVMVSVELGFSKASLPVKPPNSITCALANVVTLIAAVTGIAVEKSVTSTETDAFEELADNEFPVSPKVNRVERATSSERNLVISEIATVSFSNLPLIRFFFGSVSANTKLSTNWVIFIPEPLVLSVLK